MCMFDHVLGGLCRLLSLSLQEEVARQKLVQLQASSTDKVPRLPQLDHLGRAAAVGGRKTSVARVSKRFE